VYNCKIYITLFNDDELLEIDQITSLGKLDESPITIHHPFTTVFHCSKDEPVGLHVLFT